MFLRFLHPDGIEVEREFMHYPFIHDAGFKYHPGQALRFDTKAVIEHCDLLLNHFSKALDNVASKAPLTYQRAHFTSHENPLILAAAERSERRLLGHVLKFIEAKYGAHMKMNQHQLDHLLRNGATLPLIKRAISLMPLPFIDIAILQYCHMLSPLSYIDDITRNVNRLHGLSDFRYEDPLPISAVPFPLSKLLGVLAEQEKEPDKGVAGPKNFDLEPLNGRYPEPDYLHWPKGGPTTQGYTRILDEIPERMECTLCARDIYFTQDKGETWFSFLEGEFVLCRFCGCSNSLSTLRWMSLRDDMASLHAAIDYYRDPKGKAPRDFPEMPGRYNLGPFHGQHAIDRVLRHSIGEDGWTKILNLLKYKLGYEEDWDELTKLMKAIDADLPSTNLHDHAITSESRTFWQDLVSRYNSTVNKVTTVDFPTSVANLRNFIASVKHLYQISNGCIPEAENAGLISQTLDYFRSAKEGIGNPLPQGSGLKYERFMRLKAKYPEKDLLPTIAIELVWRTHLLYPAYYNRWCLEIFSCQIDHPFDRPEEYSLELLTERYETTTHLWWKEYSEEYVSPTTDWTQHFTTSNPYSTSIIPPSTRENITTVEEERAKHPYWAWDHSPAVHLLDSVEQAELYHTLFPTPLHRLLITTKLVCDAYITSSKHNPTSAVIWNPKVSPLDAYLGLHWDDSFENYLTIITTQPHLTDLFTAQVDLTVICINILFSHLTNPPTDITHIFQPRDVENDTTKEILYQKRLLMWLCIRHSPLLKPAPNGQRRNIILLLMKSLHFTDKMKFRVEISPADMNTARVINFLETHYLGAIQQIVRICDPLIAAYIPRLSDKSVTEQSETTSGNDESSWSRSSQEARTASPPLPRQGGGIGLRPFHDPVEEEQMRIALGPDRYVRLFNNSHEYGFWTLKHWGLAGHGVRDLFKKNSERRP
ncbi:hypothetical protein TWF481_005146 [Arthrobotrys musiformis]|uniref:Uncharacterized protein n=1 Tax=Arthrobotrys musiformis TaxID=47236 RepID=A0AAV9WER7_9PEZI